MDSEQEARPWLGATCELRDLLFDISDGKQTYALIGIDNETNPDHTMPLRVALMDVLEYTMQAAEISLKNRGERQNEKARATEQSAGGWNELDGGMGSEDCLTPVYIIVVN